MTKRKTSPVDDSPYTGTVVTCPECSWRVSADDCARGWYALARHLKAVHADMEATRSARKMARYHGLSI